MNMTDFFRSDKFLGLTKSHPCVEVTGVSSVPFWHSSRLRSVQSRTNKFSNINTYV